MSGAETDDDVARLRTPPHALEAEQSVLGALLQDNRTWDRVGDILTGESFYRHEHRLVFEAIGGLVNACKGADAVTVAEVLKRAGASSEIGLSYLQALAVSVPSASNARRYAEIVAERALERRIIAAADDAASLAFNGAERATDKLDRITTAFRLLEGSTLRHAPRPLSEIVVRRIDHLNELHEQGDKAVGAGWPTPLPSLNRFLSGGMRPGRVYVIAARPSVGKSALAQSLAVKFAVDGLPVLFLSQEMPEAELADRIIAQIGGVDFGHLQSAKLNDAEWGGVSHGCEMAGRLPFYVDDQASLTVGQIRAKARQVPGLRVLVVDYLQLTASAPTNGRREVNRNAEIEEVSRGLKTLAKELGVAVVLLSQLNREVEKRVGRKPLISDLRDSGAIEQDADVIALLWPLSHSVIEDCSMVGLHIAKNRGGPKDGEIALCFWGRHMRFAEADLPVSHYLEKPAKQTESRPI